MAQALRAWALALACAFGLLGIAAPRFLDPVYRAWMAVGEGLGWVNRWILLGIVFYGVLTPMGIVMRLAGRDPMRRRFNVRARYVSRAVCAEARSPHAPAVLREGGSRCFSWRVSCGRS